jgi:medium-chain acyl-[acyl-carrier-protein] hydrolase
MQTIWFEETRVKTYETDFQYRWKPACFFQTMQEAAAHHASHLGFDHKEMMHHERVWILSRVRIRFHTYPTLDDTVKVETWPKGLQQRLLFMRDFIITSTAGNLLAEASTAWLLVNPNSRRILPPNSLDGDLPDNGGRAAVAEPLDKLNPPDGLPQRQVFTAGYSAIDLMGHVTNARYLDWISDAFTMEEHAARRLAELQINYTSEVLPGEQVVILAGPRTEIHDQWWVQGVHQANGARAFEALLKFDD